ncbi:hypothetical protein HYT57_02855 [Candidatus Woesearchaeota archaeon]|nr:hypothetical protein [Candidatus Woesearchaeota archaeon]
MKAKKKFVRHESVHFKSLGSAWRRPRGIHNKLRLCKGGQGLTPKIGYGSGKDKKFLIKGMEPTIVHTIKDLTLLNAKKDIVIIAASVGMKKKIMLIQKMQELKFQILNIKDVAAFLIKAEELKNKKKQEKKKQEVKVEEKKKTLTEEEKKEAEKEEKRKVLEKGLK